MNKGASFGRRDFFKGACVAGFMVAVGELPAVAEGERPKFEVGKRGAHSRLATSYAVVDIGLEKPFSVLHISDTHLADAYPDEHPDKVAAAAKRTAGFGARQEEALAESLEWALCHSGKLKLFNFNFSTGLFQNFLQSFGSGFVNTLFECLRSCIH